MEAVNPAGFLRLIHLKGRHLPLDSVHSVIGRPKRRLSRLQSPKAVQIVQMTGRVQKLLSIVLTMDVQKLSAQLPELGDRQRAPVQAAKVLPVRLDLPLEEQGALRVRPGSVFPKPSQVRQAGKLRADKSRPSSGADQIPGGPLADDGANGIHHDGLAGARLTR